MPSILDKFKTVGKFQHNFRRIYRFQNDVPALRKPKKGSAKWWCDQCDTLVIYSDRLTDTDVNRAMSNSKLPCVGQFTGEIHIT